MVTCDLLVVGGGAAASAAVRGFRARHDGAVLLASAEHTLPYTRPALSKDFLRGGTDTGDLPVEPTDWYAGVDLRLGTPVVALDPGARVAILGDGTRVSYVSCVLATGADAKPLPVPGADDPRLFLLRSAATALRLRAAARAGARAVVIGSGFIGCEAAASLARRGLRVVIVSPERRPQEKRLGRAAAEVIAGWLRSEGVELVLGTEVTGIHEGRRLSLRDREPIDGDLVLCAGGIGPRAEVAAAAGVALSDDGRVLVDDRMRASVAGVFAAGDVALAYNRAAGRRLMVEHWGDALRMGEIAGATAADGEDSWQQVPGFWTEIGDQVLKYAAWGDGFDEVRVVEHGTGSFTHWYGRDGTVVGALTCRADGDYERANDLVARGAAFGEV